MPLHPALQPFLDAFAQAPPPPEDPIERVAAMRLGVATFNTVGAGAPEAVHAIDDLVADGPHGPIPVRRYLPSDDVRRAWPGDGAASAARSGSATYDCSVPDAIASI